MKLYVVKREGICAVLKRVVTILLICLTLTACTSKNTSIEGYWMAENGDTITFNANDEAIIDNISLNYSVFDNNKLTITKLGIAKEYSFSISKDCLTLKDLDTSTSQTYYKDEKKQEQIKQAIEEINDGMAAQEEQSLYSSSIQDEYVSEQQALKSTIETYTERKNQCQTAQEKNLCEKYVSASKARIKLLNEGTDEEIQTNSYKIAEEIIKTFTLPSEIATSEKLILMDEGTQYISAVKDRDPFIGCVVDVRINSGEPAPEYGTYAVQLSSRTIYKYDVVANNWAELYQLPAQGTYRCTIDEQSVLSVDTAEYIELMNTKLRCQTGAEIVVKIINSTGSVDIGEYAQEEFSNFGGIGSKEKNNGILIVMALKNKYKGLPNGDYYMAWGAGFTEKQGEKLDEILNTNMEKNFAAKEYDAAVRQTFDSLVAYFETLYGVKLAIT